MKERHISPERNTDIYICYRIALAFFFFTREQGTHLLKEFHSRLQKLLPIMLFAPPPSAPLIYCHHDKHGIKIAREKEQTKLLFFWSCLIRKKKEHTYGTTTKIIPKKEQHYC